MGRDSVLWPAVSPKTEWFWAPCEQVHYRAADTNHRKHSFISGKEGTHAVHDVWRLFRGWAARSLVVVQWSMAIFEAPKPPDNILYYLFFAWIHEFLWHFFREENKSLPAARCSFMLLVHTTKTSQMRTSTNYRFDSRETYTCYS